MLGLVAVTSASAQIQLGKNGGQLAASFETNSVYYVDDSKLGDAVNHWGSNSYLKLDYTWDRLSVGAQGDFFLPALQGYEMGQYHEREHDHLFLLGSAYVQWMDRNYSVRLGSPAGYQLGGDGRPGACQLGPLCGSEGLHGSSAPL